ncbi:MAG: 50S ribosomal protein L21 [Peptococcia bacterium]
MYAIIETGGKQYKVEEGDVFNVEKVPIKEGETFEATQVLAVVDGENVSLGTPFVEGASVTLKVLEHGKGDKIVIFKHKPKKHYRKTRGHRQPYTKVTVETIIVNG